MARLPQEWRVPAAFALLTVGRLVYVASTAWFWDYGHHTVPVFALVFLVLLGLLLLRRRFAWWLFVVFAGFGLVSQLADVSSHGITSAWVFGSLFGLVYFGLLVRNSEAMQGVGFIVVFPLSFLGGVFVPILGMAAVPRAIGEWDPISALVAAVRKLSENFPSHGSWLLEHGELAMLLWSLLLLAIFIPLALRRFNNTLAA